MWILAGLGAGLVLGWWIGQSQGKRAATVEAMEIIEELALEIGFREEVESEESEMKDDSEVEDAVREARLEGGMPWPAWVDDILSDHGIALPALLPKVPPVDPYTKRRREADRAATEEWL